MGHARYRSGIAVAVDSPFESMADLIDAGRSGKELNYAATDALGAITMVRLGNTTGAQFKWIRYKSGQEAATAIMGGFVDVLIGNPIDITPHVKRSEAHTSELQSLMRTSYAVFSLKKKN